MSPNERGVYATAGVGGHQPVTAAQRWLARLSLLAGLAAIAMLLVGGTTRLGVLISGVVGLAVAFAGAWWFLSNGGLVRWLGAAVAIAALVFVIVLYISRHLRHPHRRSPLPARPLRHGLLARIRHRLQRIRDRRSPAPRTPGRLITQTLDRRTLQHQVSLEQLPTTSTSTPSGSTGAPPPLAACSSTASCSKPSPPTHIRSTHSSPSNTALKQICRTCVRLRAAPRLSSATRPPWPCSARSPLAARSITSCSASSWPSCGRGRFARPWLPPVAAATDGTSRPADASGHPQGGMGHPAVLMSRSSRRGGQ